MTTYRSHVGFNQQLLTDLSVVENGELALKSVYKDEVVEASSSSFKKSDSLEIKSYNQGGAQETGLMSIDSCTKTITADAFRKMLQEHPGKFPEGLETKANHFTELLKSRFPNSDYVQGRKSPNLEEELTEQITLRDLLNHTSGLGNQTHKDFDERIKSNPNHRLQEGELLEIDRKKGEYGKSEYSNQGYELLGMIMCAVEQYIQRRDAVADPVQFSEVLGKYSFEPRGLAGQIFASDQMRIAEGKVEVKDRPELKVTSGQYYHDGELHQSRPFNYDQFGAGGCYASSFAMVSYMQSFDYADFAAIFESEKSRVSKDQHEGKSYAMLQECAGFNSLVLEEASGRIDINFGGKGYGTNSGALTKFYSDGRKDLSFTVLNVEDLTYPIAVALIKKEKVEAEKYPAMDDEIYKKIIELKSVFGKEQLIEMRKGLDRSYEEFSETYKQQKDLADKKQIDALDLAELKEAGAKESLKQKSWAERTEDRKLSALKGGIREL